MTWQTLVLILNICSLICTFISLYYVNLICYLEKYLHRQYKKVKYSPLLYFQGCSECFTEINNYLNLIQQGKNSYESSINDR